MKYLDVVHLVDTEGPINEPLTLTFKRIKEIFGLQIKPSKKNLNKILNREIQLKLNAKLKKNFMKHLIVILFKLQKKLEGYSKGK